MASFYRQSLPAISAFIAYQTEGIRVCESGYVSEAEHPRSRIAIA